MLITLISSSSLSLRKNWSLNKVDNYFSVILGNVFVKFFLFWFSVNMTLTNLPMGSWEETMYWMFIICYYSTFMIQKLSYFNSGTSININLVVFYSAYWIIKGSSYLSKGIYWPLYNLLPYSLKTKLTKCPLRNPPPSTFYFD